MGGGRVTSTYRREFSPERSAKRSSIIRGFGDNYNYREYRRHIEHGHHRSPFMWDDWEYEVDVIDAPATSRSNNQSEEKAKQKDAVKSSRSDSDVSTASNNKSEGSNQGANSKTAESKKSKQKSGEDKDQSVQSKRKTDQSAQRSRRSPPPARSPSSVESDSEDCNCKTTTKQSTTQREAFTQKKAEKGVRGYRTRSPQGQPARILSDTISKSYKKVVKSRPSRQRSSPPLVRPQSAPISDSPFVQYGAGDDELETGAKRTHNILANQGVYRTAYLGKVKQSTIKDNLRRSLDLQQTRPQTTSSADPHFDRKMNRQTSQWLSEYNKNYRAFPVQEYREHMDHRPPY